MRVENSATSWTHEIQYISSLASVQTLIPPIISIGISWNSDLNRIIASIFQAGTEAN